jgi:hypothetical protein
MRPQRRSRASNIDFRRLAGEEDEAEEDEYGDDIRIVDTEDADPEPVSSNETNSSNDCCVSCGRNCEGVQHCWTDLNADAPGAVRLREALARHLSVFLAASRLRSPKLLCPNCQENLTSLQDSLSEIRFVEI